MLIQPMPNPLFLVVPRNKPSRPKHAADPRRNETRFARGPRHDSKTERETHGANLVSPRRANGQGDIRGEILGVFRLDTKGLEECV
jgi:hypothetical protein